MYYAHLPIMYIPPHILNEETYFSIFIAFPLKVHV
jgi:hypothetical protein